MAYHNNNHRKKQRHAAEVAAQYYEPGRHDRSYKWVWRKHIRDQFHIEYQTFMSWLRADKQRQSEGGDDCDNPQ